MKPFILLPAVALSLAAAASTAESANGAKPKRFTGVSERFRRSCGDVMPGFVRCHSWARAEPDAPIVVVGEPTFPTPEDFITPGDLAVAYALPSHGGEGVVVAIVDAFDDPTAESDLGTYRSHFGLGACTTANGCFRKVNQRGATSPLPSVDTGWAAEISLDLDMVSAACPRCKILLVEASSNSPTDLGAAVNVAVSLGARVVSNSYSGSESSGDPTTADAYYNHPGTLIVASSGDSGFGVEFPASAPTVLAVGGTHLVQSTSARGWTETAWSGAGSGCSSVEAKPSWQTDTGCSRRTVADVSAVADPATAVSVYQTTVSTGMTPGWQAYGGTSVAAPLVAAIFARTGRFTSQYPYGNPSKFFDVAGGSNGTCSPSYLCTAVTGYDGPTGIGSPNGVAMAIPAVASQMVVLTNL
jgi:subtilase family serine protease